MVSHTPIGRLLVHLFSRLDESGIDYCVLRNYEGLPDQVDHDVDLLVAKNSVRKYEYVLSKGVDQCGWIMVKKAHRFSFRSYYLVHKDGIDFIPLHIDIWAPIHWRAITTACETVILKTRRQHRRGFWVASYGSEVSISLFKEYLQFGKVKDLGDGRHKQHFAKLAREDSENFIDTVEPYIGKRIADFSLECAQKEDWDRLEKNVGRVRHILIARALIRRPIGQVIDWIRFLCGHFSDKILHPSGLFICLIGPDGSGKTTISRGLRRDMADVFSKIRYYHGHLGILPPLKRYYNFFARLLGKPEIKTPSNDTVQNFNIPPFGLLRALIYIIYYSFDYLLGYITIHHAKSQGQLVLFDRYFYDYLIQHTFSNVPPSLIRTILWFLPKPEVLIWLDNRPDVIYSRKPELTLPQIKRQCDVCRDLIARHHNAVTILTDDHPEITLHHVREVIFRSMAERIVKRKK